MTDHNQAFADAEAIVSLVATHIADTAEKLADQCEQRREPLPPWVVLRKFATAIRTITAENFDKPLAIN